MKHLNKIIFPAMLFCFALTATAQWMPSSNGDTSYVTYCFVESSSGILLSGGNDGIFSSGNFGSTWTVSNAGIAPYCFGKNSAGIFAGTDKIYFSNNNGISWSVVQSADVFGFAFLSDTVFAAAFQGGVLMSPDNGVTWITRNSGLGNDSVYSILAKGNLLFAGTFRHGIFVSSDAGGNWAAVNTGLPLPTDVKCLETDGVNLYAGTVGIWNSQAHGMFRSSDNGLTWSQVTNGISVSGYVNCIKSIGTTLLAGVAGVYRSLDSGSTWSIYTNGMDTCLGGISRFYETSSYVFCGMEGGCVGKSIFRIDKNQVLAGIETQKQSISFSVFPNPANKKTILNFDNSTGNNFTLTILDTKGRLVQRINNITFGKVEIATENLSSGIYFLQLQSDKKIATGKLLIE